MTVSLNLTSVIDLFFFMFLFFSLDRRYVDDIFLFSLFFLFSIGKGKDKSMKPLAFNYNLFNSDKICMYKGALRNMCIYIK